MNQHKKLIDLLCDAMSNAIDSGCEGHCNSQPCLPVVVMAERLIENGVTVNGWIPASEPPKEKGWYWVYVPKYYGGSSSGKETINGIAFAKWNGKSWSIETGYYKRPGCVTHWMPLPEPPKEG